jgi:hypothetical protein
VIKALHGKGDFSSGAVRDFIFGALICLILTCAPADRDEELADFSAGPDDWEGLTQDSGSHAY